MTDVEVSYQVLGEGTPIYVLHGGPGLDHAVFRPWIDPLAQLGRLVLVDLPGVPDGDGRPLADIWSTCVEALREELDDERIVVLGHGYGGFVAQEYALAHPERVAALILVATAPWPVADLDMLRQSARADVAPARLEAIEVPTLIIAGRHDPIAPPDAAFALYEPIPDAELLLFEKSGHTPFVDQPLSFLAGIANFFGENHLGATPSIAAASYDA